MQMTLLLLLLLLLSLISMWIPLIFVLATIVWFLF